MKFIRKIIQTIRKRNQYPEDDPCFALEVTEKCENGIRQVTLSKPKTDQDKPPRIIRREFPLVEAIQELEEEYRRLLIHDKRAQHEWASWNVADKYNTEKYHSLIASMMHVAEMKKHLMAFKDWLGKDKNYQIQHHYYLEEHNAKTCEEEYCRTKRN